MLFCHSFLIFPATEGGFCSHFSAREQRFRAQRDGRTPDPELALVCLQVLLSPGMFTALPACLPSPFSWEARLPEPQAQESQSLQAGTQAPENVKLWGTSSVPRG